MGRSVETPLNAETTFFHHWDIEPEDYDIAADLFHEDIIDPVRDALRAAFPSFEYCDEPFRNPNGYARYDETCVILENGHALVTISEYCGLVAVSLVPIEPDDYDEGESNLHSAWCGQIAAKFQSVLQTAFGGGLVPVATASNGETFFKRVAA